MDLCVYKAKYFITASDGANIQLFVDLGTESGRILEDFAIHKIQYGPNQCTFDIYFKNYRKQYDKPPVVRVFTTKYEDIPANSQVDGPGSDSMLSTYNCSSKCTFDSRYYALQVA